MNWEAIGAIGEIVGATAVFASLIYLAIQIKNSTKIELARSERELHDKWNALVMNSYGNAESARIFNLGRNDLDSLTEAEQLVYFGLLSCYVSYLEECIGMHDKNLIPEDMRQGAEKFVVDLLRTPGGNRWFKISGPYLRKYNQIKAMLEDK